MYCFKYVVQLRPLPPKYMATYVYLLIEVVINFYLHIGFLYKRINTTNKKSILVSININK